MDGGEVRTARSGDGRNTILCTESSKDRRDVIDLDENCREDECSGESIGKNQKNLSRWNFRNRRLECTRRVDGADM